MWFKRSLFVLMFCLPLIGQAANPDFEKVWNFEMSWSQALVCEMQDRLNSHYLPYGEMLENYCSGAEFDFAAIVEASASLPEVEAIVAISRLSDPSSYKVISGEVKSVKKFVAQFIDGAPVRFDFAAPMMGRLIGGKCRLTSLSFKGKSVETLSLTREITTGEKSDRQALVFILNQRKQVDRIRQTMPEIFENSSMLLFWAPSPRNHLVKQSLGLTYGADTLWWSGPKDLNIMNIQEIYPESGIKMHIYVKPE